MLFLSVFFLFIIFFDLITKHFFNGTAICNDYISFNIRLNKHLFYIFWLIINIILLYLLFFPKNTTFINKISLIFILSGSLSNILDRLYYGCVRDFIPFISKSFFMFNIADAFIFFGFLFFLYGKMNNVNKLLITLLISIIIC